MSMSDLYPSGPAPQPAPGQCRCIPEDGQVIVFTLERTLMCPALWAELPDGRWQHAWPARKRQVTR